MNANRTTSIVRATVLAVLVAAGLSALVAGARADEPFELEAPPPGRGMVIRASLPGPFPGPMMGDGPAGVMPLLLQASGLSEEQRKQAHEIMMSRRATLDELFDRLRTLNDQLAAKLLAPGTLTEQDLAPLVQEIAGARESLIQDGIKAALAVRNLLTPEQLGKASDTHKRLEELEAERRELLGDRVLFFAN
jgi:Spy/CpxP family protein refolding chaperone